MKILYGVQATGNGHITRARAMNKQFQAMGADVDFLFSGRERSHFFDMEEFGDWRCHRGLTFYHEAGDLKIVRTVRNNNLFQFWQDVKGLSLEKYDIVLTDYEPITAWACRRAKRDCIGIGHQYAFNFDVPRRGDDMLASFIMRNFAPVNVSLGLHWHHFNQAILPPIAEVHESDEVSDPNKIVVYLGFEAVDEVIALLEPFENHLFVFYGPFPQYESRGHIQLKPLSREGFKHDLATAGGVICNAGFELSSEAIQLGKKLLIKPLKGQVEQLSNARALEELGLGMSMDELDPAQVKVWLDNWSAQRVVYPDVPKAIAQWVLQGDWKNADSRAELSLALWQQTLATGVKSFESNPTPPLEHAVKTQQATA